MNNSELLNSFTIIVKQFYKLDIMTDLTLTPAIQISIVKGIIMINNGLL